MPLPLAHSLAGLAIYKGFDADGRLAFSKRLLLAVFIANLPDLDMLPGIALGEPNLYHHVWWSHSLFIALIAGVIAAWIARGSGRAWPVRGEGRATAAGTALMVAALMGSHVLLDTMNRDMRPPAGPPAFWPVWTGGVQTYPWFLAVDKLGGGGAPMEFVLSLLTAHNLLGLFWEFVTLAPIVVLVCWWRGGGVTAGKQTGG